MAFVRTNSRLSSRTQTVVFCGLTIALLTVSAWITVPIGPIPVTLQTFAIMFSLLILTPRQAIISLAGYILLGVIGFPVFSAMRGGIGVFLGPTGGFLWGFLVGAIGALLMLRVFAGWDQARTARKGQVLKQHNEKKAAVSIKNGATSPLRGYLPEFLAAAVFMVLMDTFGWLQLVLVTGMSPEAAFITGIAPFIVIDTVKMIAAVIVAHAVKRALY